MEVTPAFNWTEFEHYILTHSQLRILAYIDIVSASLSILGSGSIIIAVLLRCRSCVPEVHPIFQLSCADFMASLTLVTSTVLYLLEYDVSVHPACPWLIALISALYVTTFLITMLYAVEVFRRMQQRLQGIFSLNSLADNRQCSCTMSFMGIAYLVAWVMPTLTSILYVLIPQEQDKSEGIIKPVVPAYFKCQTCIPVFHYNEDLCWQDDVQRKDKNLVAKYLLLVPLTAVIIANCIFYILAIYMFRQTQVTRGVLGYHQYKEERRIRNKAILYQVVFIVCWLPTLVLGFISLSSAFNMQKFFWLYIVQACLCPLQGFFNCIIYGWKRKGFTQALYETQPLTNTDMPSYSTYSL